MCIAPSSNDDGVCTEGNMHTTVAGVCFLVMCIAPCAWSTSVHYNSDTVAANPTFLLLLLFS